MGKSKKRLMQFLVVLAVFLMAGLAMAADVYIGSVDVQMPSDLAVTSDGGFIVGSSKAGGVLEFGPSGDLKGSKIFGFNPSALAVSPSGNIYIGIGKYSDRTPADGNNLAGEVRVYDSGYNYLFSLGSGAGEFINPVDIAIDQSGLAYVVDTGYDGVKVFNPDGSPAFSFGQSGSTDGAFNMPVAIGIDEAAGEIYVADRPLVSDGSGESARIQAFSTDGQFLRVVVFAPQISDRASDMIYHPTDIVPYNGRLYVTDTFQNVVQVYDAVTGAWLYALYDDPAISMRVPVSAAVSGDGILYVSAGVSDRVYEFGLGAYVAFSVTPAELFYSGAAGETPPSQNVTVSNDGAGQLSWSASADQSWIVLGSLSGVVDAGTASTLSVGVDSTGLPPGDYNGTVTVSSAGGTTHTVSVTLTVTPPPVLTVTPSALSFAAEEGGSNPASQGVVVSLINAGPDSFWTASSDATWLSFNPVQAGSGSTDVFVNVDVSGLAAGIYIGHITVESAGAEGSPAVVTVTLDIVTTTAITVTTNLAEATFTIAGPADYSGSGTSWSVTGAPAGEYTITYGDVPGYRTPASETQILGAGGTIAFNGNYTRINESIVNTREGGKKAPTRVKITDSTGNVQADFIAFPSYTGGIETTVADLNGDGTNELIAALNIYPLLGVFDGAGNEILKFKPFVRGGISVTAVDIDGDGDDEVVVASRKNSVVKVFNFIGIAKKQKSLRFKAFPGESAPNTLIAAGDVDGDAQVEIVTVTGPKKGREPLMRIWGVDTSGPDWVASLESEAVLPFRKVFGIDVSDIDGDGVSDIIVTSGARVAGLNIDGTVADIYMRGSGFRDVSSGDPDGDGSTELVVGAKGGNVLIFDMTGNPEGGYRVFNVKSGVRVSTGALGY